MKSKLIITVLFLVTTTCLSQVKYPRPSFPDVFQTEFEGTFINSDGVVEIDASMYYDRTNNRAALFVTKEGELTRLIFNFDSDETISIDGNECEVQEIPEEEGFFPFAKVKGKKKMSSAEETFFFTKSELDSHSLEQNTIPTLLYKANIDIPRYGQSNCDVNHVFSKPDVELPTCKEGLYCNSTLITISVKCKNEEGGVILDHVYRFFRFVFEIRDESVFLPPPGVHCDMKNAKTIPETPPYFSFTYDIIEKPSDTEDKSAVFNTHKEVWYDSKYNIVRIDEFDYSGLLYSSRIFDLRAGVSFIIIPSVPSCEVGPASNSIKFDDITRLPKSFFSNDDSITGKAVYVGKRKVHGLDYDVWSRMWSDKESEARTVEEVYILQVLPNKEITQGKSVQIYPLISHVDMYTYEMNEDSNEYELELLKYYSINNFREKPKEWAAFDVSTCFSSNQMKEFSIKVKGPALVKGSQSYRIVLELLYDKIIETTGVSVVRISELRGIFDGIHLTEVRGLILDNSESVGWPKGSKEPGMDETFKLIQKAASKNKLSFNFTGTNNEKINMNVLSAEEIRIVSGGENNCYSGASLAAASLVLLLMGIAFGVAGYYVFLKKKRPTNNIHVRMSEIDSEHLKDKSP